jgi:tetratricopeptide (TPR) repeat protein
VALAVAGLVAVATLHQPATAVGPSPDQAAVLRAHLATAPDDAAAWAELGTLALQQAAHTGDPRYYPGADAALGRSLLLRPDDNVAALNGLAALRTAQHRYGEAQDLALRAVVLNPQNPAAWATLADAASGLGRYAAARDAVGRMLDQRSDVAALTRSAALDELGGRVDAARATLERAVGTAVSPAETAHVHGALADLAFAGGDPLEAQRQIRLARTADPDDPDLLASQAAAEAAVGMIPAALADYSSVVDSAAVADTTRATAGAPATVGAAAGDPDGRRLVAPRHLIAAGELFEAAGRPVDARRAYDRFGAVTALSRRTACRSPPSPPCSPPTGATRPRRYGSPTRGCAPGRPPRPRMPTRGRWRRAAGTPRRSPGRNGRPRQGCTTPCSRSTRA